MKTLRNAVDAEQLHQIINEMTARELLDFIDNTPATDIDADTWDELHVAIIYKLREFVAI